MDVVAFCLVLLALTAFVARPLYARTNPLDRRSGRDLETNRDIVVRALSDLEIDHAAGAMDEATYEAERASLEGRGTKAIHDLDARGD